MIDHHEALIYTMVLISAADQNMTDAELHTIGELVNHLPVFRDFDRGKLVRVAQDCAAVLDDLVNAQTLPDLASSTPIDEIFGRLAGN